MEEYLRKQLRQNMKLSQRANISNMSEATRLLEKKKELFEVQNSLDRQKRDFRQKEEQLKKWEHELRERDTGLQESLEKFGGPLQELNSKRERNEKKAAMERRKRIAEETEIEQLMETISAERTKKEAMEGSLDKLMVYTRYLEGVVEKCPEEFPEVADILQRMEALTATRADLVKRIEELDVDLESTRAKVQQYTNASTDTVLGLQNQVVQERKAHEQYVEDDRDLEQFVERRFQDAVNVGVSYGQSVMACDNLLQRVLEAKSGPQREVPTDPIVQLSVVNQYILDIMEIIDHVNNRDTEEEFS